MKSAHLKILFVFVLIIFGAHDHFAQTEREKGIESYKTGNYAEAIRLLNQAAGQKIYKNDGEMWDFRSALGIDRTGDKSGERHHFRAGKNRRKIRFGRQGRGFQFYDLLNSAEEKHFPKFSFWERCIYGLKIKPVIRIP